MYLKVLFPTCIIFVVIWCTCAAPSDLGDTTSLNEWNQKASSIVEEVNVLPDDDKKINIARTAEEKEWKFQPDVWNDTQIEIFRTSNDDHNCFITGAMQEEGFKKGGTTRIVKNKNKTAVTNFSTSNVSFMWIYTIILILTINNF